MRRFTKNCNLFDFAPELVKEWHPSANGRLTPQNTKIAYKRKVWWICGQSHEWKTTIKSRIHGSNCPHCVQDEKITGSQEVQKNSNSTKNTKTAHSGLKTPLAVLEADPTDDNFGHDFRKSRRYKIRLNAMLEIRISGHWFYADVKNFSIDGMCFESEAPVKPGTQVIVKLDRPLFASNRKNYKSIIRWCRKLENDDKIFTGYAMGAIFI